MADEQADSTPTNTPEAPEIQSVPDSNPEPAGHEEVSVDTPKPIVGGSGKGWKALLKNKKRSVPAAIALLLVIVFGLPVTRYKVLGLFISKNLSVVVTDSVSGKPVSATAVTFAGKGATTDADGKANFKVKVGSSTLVVKKNYYADYSSKLTMPLSGKADPVQVSLKATGRQVPITVSNKISGQPLADATVNAADTSVRTDKDGKAIMVLPADQTTVDATITANGFNQAKAKVTITDKESKDNALNITPTGKIYFLSKLSGKIDVVKTNLDGTERQTVLKGTGKEEDTSTVLLASRDWKYLALKSRRDSKLAKLYLIQTDSDKLSTMDEGDATFNLVGWHNDTFVYEVERNSVKSWQPKAASIKSFNATSQKLTTLDSTTASGSNDGNAKFETFRSLEIYLLGSNIIYTKTWNTGTDYDYQPQPGQKNTINSISPDGSNHKVISTINATSAYIGQTIQPEAYKLFIEVDTAAGSASYYSLDSSGTYKKDSSVSSEDFSKVYPTYLQSPSGKSTFWAEGRDGKNSLFIGNSQGEKGKQIASLSDYKPYGWFSDNYVLMSKDSSELYISSTGSAAKPIKISDYHKPDQNFLGYGGGYGGI